MAPMTEFAFAAALWREPGEDGWYFVSIPADISDEISDITAGIRRGFGSVRVAVTVGTTSWQTSIFPDSKTGTYLLPVKKAVRAAERLEPGYSTRAKVELLDLQLDRGASRAGSGLAAQEPG